MTAVRKTPDSTNGSPPYDGLAYQRNVNSEVSALWQVATTLLTNVAGTNDITATSDTTLVAAISAYSQPMSFWFTPVATNTGGMTINIDAVGVLNLKDFAAATLAGGTVVLGSTYLIMYDGTQFRVIGGGTGTSIGANNAPDMIIRDEKTTATAGGTFTTGSFATRTLNTAVRNVLSGATLASNQFTLQAGTYYIQWSAPANQCGLHQSRLYNATDAATVETGTSAWSSSVGAYAETFSTGSAVVTITSAKAFEIDHSCGVTRATDGLGLATSLGAKEVYTWVNVWQVGSLPSQVNGVPGGAITWPVIYSTTTTDADPGPGTFRFNNVSIASATICYVDLLDSNGTTITALIDSFNGVGGMIRFVKYDDPTHWAVFNVTSWTTATGYRKLGLSYIGSSSSFSNGDRLYLAYSAAPVLSGSSTAGIGYSVGAGGTVTQTGSRTTGVTLSKVSGAITLVSAAGSATPASFTVTNTVVAATDTIVLSQKSGTDLYNLNVTAVGSGTFKITFYTTGGTTTEQPVFNFNVIKGVAS